MENRMTQIKETLGGALDCSYASNSGINCSDLNHADLILEAAQRLYDEWDALEGFLSVYEIHEAVPRLKAIENTRTAIRKALEGNNDTD